MKKRFALSILLCAFLVASVFAGGASENSASSQSSDALKIGLIIENTIDDKGWCQAMYDGLVQAQEEMPGAFTFQVAEKQAPVDAGSMARQFVADGYDLIIAHGAQYKNLVLEMAEDYPNVVFAYGTASDIGPENVYTYMPESEETGYLSGIIAGLITEDNIVGYVGPVDGGDAARYGRGFVMGVKKVNPDAKILVAHTGSFSDTVKAGEFAVSQIGNGADVLTGASQQAIGALTATADYPDVLWLGQDIAQFDTAAGQAKAVAASSYNYAAVIKDLVNNIKAGKKGGEVIPMNFNNGGFIFEYTSNPALQALLTDEIKSQVSAALDQMTAQAGTLANYVDVDYSKI